MVKEVAAGELLKTLQRHPQPRPVQRPILPPMALDPAGF